MGMVLLIAWYIQGLNLSLRCLQMYLMESKLSLKLMVKMTQSRCWNSKCWEQTMKRKDKWVKKLDLLKKLWILMNNESSSKLTYKTSSLVQMEIVEVQHLQMNRL